LAVRAKALVEFLAEFLAEVWVMKLRRRQLLIAGLAAGTAIAGGKKYIDLKTQSDRQARLLNLANQRDMDQVLQATFNADATQTQALKKILESVKLTPPTQPYDRQISKLLIRCSRIATEQYLKGKTIPSYSGEIASLPSYQKSFQGYTQIASFTALEQTVTEEIPLQVLAQVEQNRQEKADAIETNVNTIQSAVQSTTKELVKIDKKVPVYFGFVLSSPQAQILIFRGTQRTTEWLLNLTALQVDAEGQDTPQFMGQVHRGFVNIYQDLVTQTREIAQKLDPTKPCYISGHSLGAAIATLAAIDLAITLPQLRPQLRLYTYAHSQLVPNHYRVVNLADLVPLVPSTVFFNNINYVHAGQEWSFLSQNGDLVPNHVVDTYRAAVEQNLETNKPRVYPVSG
jgi:triacylglycerol lipase